MATPISKKTAQRQGFKVNEHIVYPSHGVGEIIAIEEQEVVGHRLELFVILFMNEKMTLRVPVTKANSSGMRKLADKELMEKALTVVEGRARIKRTMWSRRAQEYEAKINSGDLISVAEVVRDLYRAENQPEQSYSERQLYEQALERMAREVSAVRKILDSESVELIQEHLGKKLRRAAKSDDLDDAADVAAA